MALSHEVSVVLIYVALSQVVKNNEMLDLDGTLKVT